MRQLFFIIATLFSSHTLAAQDTVFVSEDLYLLQISESAYIHISYFDSPEWGRFPSNGLVVVNRGQALLIDTPMTDTLTRCVIDLIRDSLKAELVGFVPNHWHNDCTEGLDVLHERNIPSYANHATNALLESNGRPVANHSFQDSMIINIGEKEIVCDYLGEGHTSDNIVVWLPSEKVLFAGCMAKSLGSKTLGNTADASLEQWPLTIGKVFAKYNEATIVIPGHGAYGDLTLLEHTLELLQK